MAPRLKTHTYTNDLNDHLAALDRMALEPLRAEWLRLYRQAPPPRLSRDLLARGIAHKLQEAAHGGLRPAARRKLASVKVELTDSIQKHAAPTVSLMPGATLVRTWQGQTHTVQVLQDGFEHDGQRYRSLSHIAKTITGAHWSGPRFFGLAASSATEGADAQAS